MKAIKQIIDTYNARGFKVRLILGVWQFERLRKTIKAVGIILDVTRSDEHVPDVERYIRKIKEE